MEEENKTPLGELFKVLLWVAVLLILGTGLYFLLRYLTG